MKTQTAVDEFVLSRRANGASERTVKWYQSLLAAFATVHPDLRVSTHDLRTYIVGLREKLAQTSVNGHVTAMHVFFTWCADEYTLPNPMRGIKRPKPVPAKPRAINPVDFVKLLQHANIRDTAILCFLADTGARLSGVVNLKLPDLDISRHQAIVFEKGNKARKVYYTSFTAQVLSRWLDVRVSDTDYVFVSSSTGEGLTDSGITQVLKRLKRRSGVTGRVNPHSFRHHFAREYVLNGGDIVTLARLLGHNDISTTAAYYAVFSDQELAQLHERYSPMKAINKLIKS